MKLLVVIVKLYFTVATVKAVQHTNTNVSIAPNSTLDYLQRTLDGLERAFEFFSRVYMDVNLDAVIGTRIVEASFNVLLQRLEMQDMISKVPHFVISKIEHIRDVANEISEQAVPHIKESQPDYYAKIGPILSEGLFELDYDSRPISRSAPVWLHSDHEAMNEEKSDNCIAEVCGTKNGKTCAISNRCWKRMTDLGYNRYSLSHEIFYLEIAEGFGCQLEMSWFINANKQGRLRRLHDTFCANMLDEAVTIADKGFQPEARDLFMEQAALCGMLGYRDFFNNNWLDHILSWQDSKDGCYKWSGWNSDHRLENFSQRTKREEKRIENGCLCHRTTVAVSALSQYVRYILEVWFLELP